MQSQESCTSNHCSESRPIDGYGCKFCLHLSADYCTKGKQFHKDKGCDRFTAYQIYCIDLCIGDEIIYYQKLTHFTGWMKGIVKEIDQSFITLESGRLLPHSVWRLANPKPLNHCSNCNSFDSAIKNDSPWAFCLLKGKYIARDELTTCDDFTPIIPYQAPAKTRRSRGDGSGSIVKRFLSKKTKKETKSYEQYWYDYELWESGVCLRKGTAYIPKNKLEEIELMNKDKKPVKLILKALGKTV